MEKTYSGTNKAVYRSQNVQSTKMYLRVDDTTTIAARVVGYETMTDVDTGTGPFPTAAQLSGGGAWHKSQSTDATSRAYALFADDSCFVMQRATYGAVTVMFDGFGDFKSEKQGDAYRCVLSAYSVTGALGTGAHSGFLVTSGSMASSLVWAPRSYSQLGSSIELATYSSNVGGTNSGAASGGLAYPSPVTNGLILTKAMFKEGAGPLRCLSLTGIYHTPQALPLADRDKVVNVTGLDGRTVMMLAVQGGTLPARVAVDITGPWQ